MSIALSLFESFMTAEGTILFQILTLFV